MASAGGPTKRMVSEAGLPRPGLWSRLVWWARHSKTLLLIARASRLHRAFAFGAGFALVAGIGVLLIVSPEDRLENAVLSSHLRAEQPGHPIAVILHSSQAARLWFKDRLEFTPPVRDLTPAGFSITGARLDFVAGHFVSVIVYRAPEGLIDLYSWPDGAPDKKLRTMSSAGHALRNWTEGGLQLWVISQVPASRLEAFIKSWRATKD